MNIFTLYDEKTGLFIGQQYRGSAEGVLDLLPIYPHASFVLGDYHHEKERVDLETGLVVPYQPPCPGAQYEWDETERVWVYVKTPAELLADAQAEAMKRVNYRCSWELSQVRAGYPSDEVESWSKQEAEARAWTADNAAPTPLLSAMAASRGIDLPTLAGKVIEKADAFAVVSGQIIGARQAAEDRINAATDADAVQAIMAELFPA